jgi:Serine hydrolase (FSH1)
MLILMKILGHAESGPKFYAKTRPLEKHLHNTFPPAPLPGFLPEFPGGIELFYPTAPLRLTGADVTRGCGPVDLNSHRGEVGLVSREKDLDAWAWGTGDFRRAEEIRGLDQSVAITLEFMKAHGPFVGAIGFSCGATLAAILASLLEGDKRVEGWRFDNVCPPCLTWGTSLTSDSSVIHLFVSQFATVDSRLNTRHTNPVIIRKSKRLFCTLLEVSIP